MWFFAWLQTGIASLRRHGSGPTDVALAIDGIPGGVTAHVPALGPADVARLGPQAIVRRTPQPGTTDFEPSFLAAIELADADLPWFGAIAPTEASAKPWLALVVVEPRAGVAIAPASGDRLAMLSIATPADARDELPDAQTLDLWAHVQVMADDAASAAQAAATGARTVARLVCPRRLQPRRRYTACLVPAVHGAALAGLGLPPSGDQSAPAWTASDTSVQLPVYAQWSFGTGEAGDFESLARRLVPGAAPTSALRVDLSEPRFGAPAQPGLVAEVPGALMPAGAVPAALPAGAADLASATRRLVDDGQATSAAGDLMIGPPLYGGAHAAVTRIPDAPHWVNAQNGDPRARIAAGVAAEVVRRFQDDLAEAAWRQVGDEVTANQLRARAQAAAEVQQRMRARHLAARSPSDVLQLTRAGHARIRMTANGDDTLDAAIGGSRIPRGALDAQFHKLVRRDGPIGRRLAPGAGPRAIGRLNRGEITSSPPRVAPHAAVLFDAVSEAVHIQPRYSSATADAVDAAAIHWTTMPLVAARPVEASLRRRMDTPDGEDGWIPDPIEDTRPPVRVVVDRFRAASMAHQRYLVGHVLKISDAPPRPVLGLVGTVEPLVPIAARVVAALDPAPALERRIAARLDDPRGPRQVRLARSPATGLVAPTDATDPAGSAAITLARDGGAVDLLSAVAPGLLLPGIADVAMDSATLLRANAPFVRAFLVGLNHAVSAELAWRRIPTDPRTTWFTSFWGMRRPDATGALVEVADIPAIAEWPAAGPAVIAPDPTVLLVRGELVKRYPSIIFTAVEARWEAGGVRRPSAKAPLLPLFVHALGEDMTLVGFDLAIATARGGAGPSGPAGWYFVIGEHPTEPRFGLDAVVSAPAVEDLADWSDLAWDNLAPADLARGHLVGGGPLRGHRPRSDGNARWGQDSAAMASILLRTATRVAIHASVMLGPAP